MATTITADITEALKVALKSRGLSYRELGEKIGVSEKTIKRLFSDKDCSLTRLSKICDAINLSLFDLMEFAQQYKEPIARLTQEQEHFLAKSRSHFSFIFLLTIGYTAEQIQARYELSDMSVFRYLRDLDANHLIELGANNQYRLLIKGKLLLKLHGPLHDTIRASNTLFLDYVIDCDKEPGVSFNSSYRFMSPESLMDLNAELNDIHHKYKKVAHRDEAVLARDKLLAVKWTTAVAPFEIFGRWPINELEK